MAKKKSVKDAEGTGNKMRNQIIAFVVIACVSFSGAHYYITNGPALLDYESCESAARLRVIDLPLTVVSDGFRKADKTLNVNSFTSFFSTERSVEDLAKSLKKVFSMLKLDSPLRLTLLASPKRQCAVQQQRHPQLMLRT